MESSDPDSESINESEDSVASFEDDFDIEVEDEDECYLYAGFSLTFEVEGHWLVSREVPCETEGRRPETVGGSGGMLPRKIFRT